jgi:hypothetical protein
VSASSKLRIRSTNDGIDPVVIAFSLGMVTVGERALAVKGIATPSRIRLPLSESYNSPEANHARLGTG